MTIKEVLDQTDWKLLCAQEAILTELAGLAFDRDDPEEGEALNGLLAFLDALQEAAKSEGYPVVFRNGFEELRRGVPDFRKELGL